jgi:phage anti-repressor protein
MNDEIVLKDHFSRIVESQEPYPVDFDQAWQWIGYSTKQKAREALEKNFEDGIDYTSFNLTVKREIGATNKIQINLTIDCFKSFCMMAGTGKGKEVRRYYLEIEKKYLEIRRSGISAMPGIGPFPELSTARLHELRMILREGSISVREFRRLAFNLDTPDVPNNPIKGALVFKTHDDFMEYAETHKKANPTVYNFAKTALKITGTPDDFVLIRDLYRLYREAMNTWKAETRNTFTSQIKKLYPALEYKQRKVNGKPELVFMGCTLVEKAG